MADDHAAFGVYEAYYIKALNESASTIAWIGSVQLWFQFSMGLLIGKAFDEGYGRLLILIGSIIYVVSYVTDADELQHKLM
jgi:MFS transporter, MCT family, solute carrier family 16 (monocarboxylic acid transporters), member 10